MTQTLNEIFNFNDELFNNEEIYTVKDLEFVRDFLKIYYNSLKKCNKNNIIFHRNYLANLINNYGSVEKITKILDVFLDK